METICFIQLCEMSTYIIKIDLNVLLVFYIYLHIHCLLSVSLGVGARCSSVVRAFAHGAMGRRIDPSWGGPIELFLVPASAPRLL